MSSFVWLTVKNTDGFSCCDRKHRKTVNIHVGKLELENVWHVGLKNGLKELSVIESLQLPKLDLTISNLQHVKRKHRDPPQEPALKVR